jgi:hypothetical protein
VADEVSYFSRFTVKFIEIVAAGLATAVSGYLIAQLGGFLSSPVPTPSPSPAAVLSTPGAGGVSGNLPAKPALSTQPTQPAQPAPPASADAGEQRPAPAQDSGPAAKQPARTTVTAAPAAPGRKHMTPDTSAAESRPREPAEKPRDTAERKPRDTESVEARVRAALANADANRPVTPDPLPPPRQADLPSPPPVAAVQPRPVDDPPATGSTAVVPRAADAPPQPLQQAPVKPDPLPAVEIKSRPVAAIEALPPPQPTAPPEADAQGEATDLVSAIRKLPEILRNDKPVPADEAPRPPLPVGQ